MMKRLCVVAPALSAALLAGSPQIHAAERKVPGYECMMLNITEQQSMDTKLPYFPEVRTLRSKSNGGMAACYCYSPRTCRAGQRIPTGPSGEWSEGVDRGQHGETVSRGSGPDSEVRSCRIAERDPIGTGPG